MRNVLACDRCGFSVSWGPGFYCGERADFAEHECVPGADPAETGCSATNVLVDEESGRLCIN
jgi:hypothetical protein